jgi:hypothetical protein
MDCSIAKAKTGSSDEELKRTWPWHFFTKLGRRVVHAIGPIETEERCNDEIN